MSCKQEARGWIMEILSSELSRHDLNPNPEY